MLFQFFPLCSEWIQRTMTHKAKTNYLHPLHAHLSGKKGLSNYKKRGKWRMHNGHGFVAIVQPCEGRNWEASVQLWPSTIDWLSWPFPPPHLPGSAFCDGVFQVSFLVSKFMASKFKVFIAYRCSLTLEWTWKRYYVLGCLGLTAYILLRQLKVWVF